MQIKKAIIPAAGFGTRVLPASKSIPKEMINIVDKPGIQYLVEEAVEAGIEDIIIVLSRGKNIVVDHFDHSFELEQYLLGKERTELYEQVKGIAEMANVYFVRQRKADGLGNAILCAKPFIGNEPFAVMYGDDVIISKDKPAIGQLCDAYEKYGMGTVGVNEVTREAIKQYCTLDVSPLEGNVMKCHNIIEKPTEEQIMSLYAILGRVVLPPEAFEMIENTPYDTKTGERYLSDAMVGLAKAGKLTAVDFTGNRYDMGSKFGILQANCEVGVDHPEIGEQFRKYLKEFVKTLD